IWERARRPGGRGVAGAGHRRIAGPVGRSGAESDGLQGVAGARRRRDPAPSDLGRFGPLRCRSGWSCGMSTTAVRGRHGQGTGNARTAATLGAGAVWIRAILLGMSIVLNWNGEDLPDEVRQRM